MADGSGDPGGAPGIPTSTNWSEWTFEQALAAVTGEGADLHALADADWFDFNTDGGADDAVSYHAYGDYYFAANYNEDAISKWQKAVGTIDGMMNDVAAGKRGEMDLKTLRELETAIRSMSSWFDGHAHELHSRATSLDSKDSGFKGKAAFLIQWRLKQAGDGFDDTYQQLTTRHGAPIADAVKGAGDALQAFNTSIVNAWHGVAGLGDTIRAHIDFEVKSIMDYIKAQGIVKGEPNYVLDVMGLEGDVGTAKDYIKKALAEYPLGDLTSAATWSKINDKITQDVTTILKGWLDPPARTAIAALQQAYLQATSALIEITAPPTENMPKPADKPPGADGPGGAGGLTPPGADGAGAGGDGGLTPPGADGAGAGAGAGGDLSPPGADGTGAGAGLPNLAADGGGGFSPPGADGTGAGAGLPNLAADGGGGFSPPGADGTGAGAGLPNLAADGGGGFSPPGADGTGAGAGFLPGVPGLGGNPADRSSRTGTAGPGADGAFNEPGGAGTGLTPPGSDHALGDLTVPPGVDTPGSAVPSGIGLPNSGADGGLAVPGGDRSKGFGATPGPFSIGPGSGSGSPSGVGLGSGGLGGGGLGSSGSGGFGASGAGGFGASGAPGAGGFGGNNFSATPGGGGGMPSPAQASGPGAPGAPGAGSGAGGVPFFPPMMGGGMGAGGGEKPQERERQTWLAEDEEIWGTTVDIGPGVIGRVEEEYGEVEEMPMTRPTRGQRRADTPRRQRPAEAGPEAVGEEAITST